MSSSLPKILEFSVFLSGVFLSVCMSVCLSWGALSPSLSFSLSLKLFLLPVLSKTPTSLRNLSEKTRAHENDRRHVLPFSSQTDRQRKERVVHISPLLRARERLLEHSRGKKSFALFLSLCIYIYRAHTASSSTTTT